MLTEIQENAIRNLINGVLKANKTGAFELGESGALSQAVSIVSDLLNKNAESRNKPAPEIDNKPSKNATNSSK